MSEEVRVELVCSYCAIRFFVEERTRDTFKKHKTPFYCPNGHALQFLPDAEDPLPALRKEIERLKAALAAAEGVASKEKARADGLEVELELWRPRTETAS